MDWSSIVGFIVVLLALWGFSRDVKRDLTDRFDTRLDDAKTHIGERITDQGERITEQGEALGQRISDLDTHLSARLDQIGERVGALERERST